MRKEIHYPHARFTLVLDSKNKAFVLYAVNKVFSVVADKQFDNEVDFKEAVRSLKSKLQNLNDKIKELKNA